MKLQLGALLDTNTPFFLLIVAAVDCFESDFLIEDESMGLGLGLGFGSCFVVVF